MVVDSEFLSATSVPTNSLPHGLCIADHFCISSILFLA